MIIRIMLLIQLLATPFVVAQIKWESVTETQNSEPFKDPLFYTFTGQVSNEESVEIVSVEANCPCVKILESTNGVVEPNESIKIIAVFTPDDLSGNQKQYIKITYKSPSLKPDILVLECLMPAVVTTDPKQLFWKTESENSAQTVNLQLNSDYKVDLYEAYVMDENFSSILDKDEDGNMTISVTPRNTLVTRPAPLMLHFLINGKSFKKIIPLSISNENPFAVRYSHKASNRPQPVDLKRLSLDFKTQSKLKTSGSVKLDETFQKSAKEKLIAPEK